MVSSEENNFHTFLLNNMIVPKKNESDIITFQLLIALQNCYAVLFKKVIQQYSL